MLLALAAVDGATSQAEQETLQRFRRHLGISERKAKRYRRIAAALRQLPTPSAQDSIDLLTMMARVAYSDGELHHAESRLIDHFAERNQISTVRVARILEEQEARAIRRLRVGCVGAHR